MDYERLVNTWSGPQSIQRGLVDVRRDEWFVACFEQYARCLSFVHRVTRCHNDIDLSTSTECMRAGPPWNNIKLSRAGRDGELRWRNLKGPLKRADQLQWWRTPLNAVACIEGSVNTPLDRVHICALGRLDSECVSARW